MKIHTLIAFAALVCAALPANALITNSTPELELPLILDSERALLLGSRSANKFRYSELDLYRRLPTHNYEPVGLHLDTNPPNLPEPKDAEGHRDIGRGKGAYPIHSLAGDIAWLSRRNVLVGARLEKRGYERVSAKGTPEQKLDRLTDLLEEHGVRVSLFDGDTYVLVEAPGQETEFPRGGTRAVQYEREREAWLVANQDIYIAQGLIYQPVPVSTDTTDSLGKDARVRHAGAWLAKVMQKEVFVTPSVEKLEFKFPKTGGSLQRSFIEQVVKQLDFADVKMVELGSHALVLMRE